VEYKKTGVVEFLEYWVVAFSNTPSIHYRDFKGILATLIFLLRLQFVRLSVLVPVVGRHDALMQSFRPQTEGFQLGIDKLGKR